MPFSPIAIGSAATSHGRDLLARGFSVSQVVHDYGDICQAVTELALEHHAPISTEEFHTLNRCLDTAIADAVTEHARIAAASKSTEEIERLGQLTHDIRNMLDTALLAFGILKRGTVTVNGSTGVVLGRSLMGLHDLVDSTMSDIRMAANQHRRERIAVTAFLNEMGVAGSCRSPGRPSGHTAGTSTSATCRGRAAPSSSRSPWPRETCSFPRWSRSRSPAWLR